MYRKKIIELILNKNKGVSQKMNKKSIMKISFISLFFSIITACSLINVSSSNNLSEISQKEFNNAIKSLNLSSGEKPTVLDVGNGKLGGSFSLKFDLNKGFKIKNNTPGTIGLLSKVNSFKVALIDGSGGPPTPGSLTVASGCGGPCGPYTVVKTSGSPVSLILKNVPTGVYYVAVAAFEDAGATTDITASSFTIGGPPKNFEVSTTGGDSNVGKITIDSSFQINGTASSNQMGVNMTLINGVGAIIESPITITSGVNPISAIQLIRFYLVDSNAGSLSATNIKAGPFDITTGTLFTNLTTGTGPNTDTALFTNVPAGIYYVATATYNTTTPINSTTNITSATANSANITIGGPIDFGTFALSNSGGDGSGSITVNSDQSLAVSPLILPLTLN